MSKVYDLITNEIIRRLEEDNEIPWRKPWIGGQVNYITQKPYTGMNTILLKKAGEYLTFRQIKQCGGYLKKGSKSEQIIFFKPVEKKIEDADETKERYAILRYYNVFHLSDVEGLKSKLVVRNNDPVEEAEKIIKGYKDCPPIQYKEQKAYYDLIGDYINIPDINSYEIPEEYYSVAFHEMIHSTGHKNKLNRGLSSNFGDDKYSREELTAEVGATMLCGMCGIEQRTIENSTAYIQSWLKVLKEDNKFIFKASAEAQKACDYILGKDKIKEQQQNDVETQ